MAKFVPSGAGKGWAKGRTALTDPRIARNAEAHRGKTYRRHVSAAQDRRHTPQDGCFARKLPLEWSETMAYVVGLMATDGCLISNRRHLNFKSEDEQLVRTFLECLGRPMRYSPVRTGTGNTVYVSQFSDVRFWRWLSEVGLSPRKSLVLGAISVPDDFLFATIRGLFDGDGHISNFVHRPTVKTYPAYEYERLWVFFNSASRTHVEWIQDRLYDALSVSGLIERRPPRTERHHEFFRLKFGKRESIRLLERMYPTDDVPKLERKWRIWADYSRRNLDDSGAAGGTRTLTASRP